MGQLAQIAGKESDVHKDGLSRTRESSHKTLRTHKGRKTPEGNDQASRKTSAGSPRKRRRKGKKERTRRTWPGGETVRFSEQERESDHCEKAGADQPAGLPNTHDGES